MSRCTDAITCARSPSGAPSVRSRSSAKALGTTNASAAATSRRCQSASAAPYVTASAREPRQFKRTPGAVLMPWQRVQSAPRVKQVPTAQTSR